MTYEDFKQLAEHPQHRDVPAIFKLEVLETEELEEKKRSHYPKYKVNTIYKRTIRLSPNTYILTALLYKSIHQNLPA